MSDIELRITGPETHQGTSTNSSMVCGCGRRATADTESQKMTQQQVAVEQVTVISENVDGPTSLF